MPSLNGKTSSDTKENRSPIEAAFMRYELAIKRVIGRITGSRDEVDDIAQEAFLRAVIAESQRPIDNAKAYLFEAARNTALTVRAKRSRKIFEAIEDATDSNVSYDEPSIEDIMIGRERFAIFCEAVALLPTQCRKVFLMCKVYGKSHKEISGTLGISESTVEKHVGTALARCAAYLRNREQGDVGSTHMKSLGARSRI